MVNSCCVCGKESDPISGRSFHRIPKDEIMKDHWFKCIGKTVSNSARICSDHFKESDFITYVSPKKLLKKSVPSVGIRKPTVKKTNSLDGKESLISTEQEEKLKIDIIENENSSSYEINAVNVRENLHLVINNKKERDYVHASNADDETPKSQIDVNEQKHFFVETQILINYPKVQNLVEVDDVNSNDSNDVLSNIHVSHEKKIQENKQLINRKKIRLEIHNKNYGHLSRIDFMTDEAWDLFVKSTLQTKNQQNI